MSTKAEHNSSLRRPPLPKPPDPPTPKFRWRTAARAIIWLGICAGFAWGAKEAHSFLLADPRFALDCNASERTCPDLEIRGAIYANRARIAQVFAPDFGKSIFRIPLAERRRHLLAIDWVRTASIARIWPNQIAIDIAERKPIAFARLPIAGSSRYSLALIDGDGVLLSLPRRVRFHLPLVSGVSEEQTDEERRIRVRTMERVLADIGPESKRVSEINIASLENIKLVAVLNGTAVELWMGSGHFGSRYGNFLNHYPEIRGRSETARVFDLRMDDRILARFAPGR